MLRRLAPKTVLLLILIAVAVPAMAAEPVGRVERVKGGAERTGADGSANMLVAGSHVYADDTVTTGEDARLRIRFGDTSSLSMGGASEMVIDELVLPTASDGGRQALDLVEGVFEFISGKIAKDDARNVAILTPAATIGIRGTQFVFGELTVGMPAGESHWGYQIYDGAIEVTSLGGSVILDEPGEGTFLPIDGIAAPTPVAIWAPDTAQEAIDLLAF